MDGWCAALLSTEFHTIYSDLQAGKLIELPVVQPYKNYIQWLESKDRNTSKNFWSDYLHGFENLTPIKVSPSRKMEYTLSHETLILDERTSAQLRNLATQ